MTPSVCILKEQLKKGREVATETETDAKTETETEVKNREDTKREVETERKRGKQSEKPRVSHISRCFLVGQSFRSAECV